MTARTQTYVALPQLQDSLQMLRTKLSNSMARRRVYRTTLKELNTLTVRDCADLGIDPARIREIAYEAAYGA